MAVPKGKVSKARRDKRRASTWKLAVPGLVLVPSVENYVCRTEHARLAARTTDARFSKCENT